MFRSVALAACLALAGLTAPGASAEEGGGTARYVSSGTAVVRADGQAVVDQGGVVCDNGDGMGTGGLCLPFGGGNAVAINDVASGENVAFQVCVDNNGDGACVSPDPDPDCPDQIAFSHDDAGAFFNPVGPLPTDFLYGCPGGQWHGYVVFLCAGVHAAGGSGHAHPATTGTGSVTSGGEGEGTFCGGGPGVPSAKPYALESGNLTCGMTASNDPSGNVKNDKNQMFGAVYGGPWQVTDTFGATIFDVTVTCTIQSDQPDHGGTGIVVSATTSGDIGSVSSVLHYPIQPGSQTYLCTKVDWNTSTGNHTYLFDADGTAAGNQCALATRIERPAEHYRSEFVPQSTV